MEQKLPHVQEPDTVYKPRSDHSSPESIEKAQFHINVDKQTAPKIKSFAEQHRTEESQIQQ